MKTTPKLSDGPNAAGSWEILWSEKRGDVWRSMRRSTKTGDRDLAEQVLAKLLFDRSYVAPVRRTVDQVFEVYLREWSTPRGNCPTDARLTKHLRAAFGAMDPMALTKDDIEGYTRKRLKVVSTSTVRRELTAFQAGLNRGYKRLGVKGVVFAFDKPAAGAATLLWLDEAQERTILQALPDASRSVALFTRMGLAYGARKTAMMELRFGAQVSFISSTVDFNVPGARRTRKRRPTGPMTPEIRHDLEVLFQQRGPGQHVLDRSTDDDFCAFMDGIDFAWVTPHCLKHSAISLMLRGGAKPEDVAKATNTDMKTILTVYRHHTADELLATISTRRA